LVSLESELDIGEQMRVVIGADHVGFELKQQIIKFFDEINMTYIDVGTHNTEMVDYPDIAYDVARKTVEDRDMVGILICGTGVGMCIAANKVWGVRAALCHNELIARQCRQDDDSNVLVLGSKMIDSDAAKRIVQIFLSTKFSEKERHRRRIDRIGFLEKKQCMETHC
jgi:ribose 5-phosphate isomerase B